MCSTPAQLQATDSWICCSFDVQGRHVKASVRRLGDDERARVAAEVAWFADGLLSGVEIRAMGWPEFLERVVSPNVTLTMDESGLENATTFWHQLFCRAFEALMTANGLDPTVRMQMQARTHQV